MKSYIYRICGVIIAAIFISFAAPECYAAIKIDGLLADDWGVTPGAYGASDWTPFSGITYTVEDQKEYFLDPGCGGQKFDAEAIYCQKNDGNIYLAIVTGHPKGGFDYYKPGDIYFKLDNGAGTVYGLKTTGKNAGKLYQNPSWYNGIWGTTNPTAMINKKGTCMGLASFVYENTYFGAGDSNDHWVMEMAIPESLFGSGWPYFPTFNIHWTQTCGNDAIDLTVPYTIPTPKNPDPTIPEPASLALVGAGLLGMYRNNRQKRV